MSDFPVVFKIYGAEKFGIDSHALGVVQINPFEILALVIGIFRHQNPPAVSDDNADEEVEIT